MRCIAVLLLVSLATLSGCGGDNGSNQNYRVVAAGRLWIVDPATSKIFPGMQSVGVSLTGEQGSFAPAPQEVSAGWSNEVYVTTSYTGTMFTHVFMGWGTNGWVGIYPADPEVVGTFTGTITINGCSVTNQTSCYHVADSPKTVNVTYTVHGLSVTPAQLAFSSAGLNPQVQTAMLSVAGAAPAYTWVIDYSPSQANWLQIRPAGTPDSAGSQTLEFSVDAAGLAAGVYSAKVTFSNPPKFTAPMAVTLTVGDPSVNFIAPYVVPAAASGNVIIRGRGFSALNPGSLSVGFDATPAVSATVVNDTEIRATHPPLSAGSYAISVTSGARTIPSRAALKLVVIDPPAFPLTTIARPATAGPPSHLIYDAERQALLFADETNQKVLRYALANGRSTTAQDGLGPLALSPDGTELITSGIWGWGLFRLDPVTLNVRSTINFDARLPSIAFANDGGLLGSAGIYRSLYRYDMLSGATTPISFSNHMSYREVFASADGHSLVLPYSTNGTVDARVYTYDARTGAFIPRPGTSVTWPRGGSVSRDGSRIILANLSTTQSTPFDGASLSFARTVKTAQTTVYDADFNVLGTLPDGPTTFVVSPDGRFAYAYYSGRVRKFNLGTAGVTEVGSGSQVAPANTAMSEMTISPDGGTLFLVGQTSVVIAPAP